MNLATIPLDPSLASSATLLTQAPSEKASPFAAAKDEMGNPPQELQKGLKELDGQKAEGTKKNSPFAAAKDIEGGTRPQLKADSGKLFWLMLPIGLAVIGYGKLRAMEANTSRD